MNRSADWRDQAKTDLEHARKSIVMGDFDWACFAAQQAAEKAVKALHLHQGTVAWGHSVLDLLDALPPTTAAGDELKDAARALDKHYIVSVAEGTLKQELERGTPVNSGEPCKQRRTLVPRPSSYLGVRPGTFRNRNYIPPGTRTSILPAPPAATTRRRTLGRP